MARDFYEAYVVYMFFAMMVAIVGDGSDEKVTLPTNRTHSAFVSIWSVACQHV